MAAIKEDARYNLKKKSKKRKKRESNALRGEDGHLRIDNEGHKKKKTKFLGGLIAFEVAADVVSNLDAHYSSKMEKKALRRNRTNKKDEANNTRKEKKKKKNKIGNEGGVSQAENVAEKVEHMKDIKRKKKKKGVDESGAVYMEKEHLNSTALHSSSSREDGGTRGHKRKEKSIRFTTEGTSSGFPENEGNGAVGHAGFVANQIEGRISEKIKSLKGKKRRKKENDLRAGSLVEEFVNIIDVPSTSNGKNSRDWGSDRKEEKFMGSDTKGDAKAGAFKTNKKNNPIEPSERSASSKKPKKVRFSDQVEFLSLADNSRGTEKLKDHSSGKKKIGVFRRGKQLLKEEDQIGGNPIVNRKEDHQTKKVDDGLIRGKRFSKEEDRIVKNSVLNYIEKHQLGEKGLEMVLKCGLYPEVRDCWGEIGKALPSRPHMTVYNRAHILFERSESRCWTPEEIELLKNFREQYGPDWKMLAEELGKHRIHVKDTWRRIKYPNKRKGRWSQDEYKVLFDRVNMDLRMKAFEEKKSMHGMLRDNISWEAIGEQVSTRTGALCCQKWYDQLTSPMVAEGKWADVDDYRLIIALDELDASCQEDVNWDNLLEHRSGDLCRKRWNQMVRNIGEHGIKSFAEQVEIMSKRYCTDVLEAREAYDSKPAVD